ncbi:hypothetical protein KY284_012805 [Solanum tuberosum]|nr:hypothetical protein KY284_012805 [Solanum tuberosum]
MDRGTLRDSFDSALLHTDPCSRRTSRTMARRHVVFTQGKSEYLYYRDTEKECNATYLTTSLTNSNGSRSGEESGSGSGSGEESDSGSQENTADPQPEVGVETEMGAHEKENAKGENDDDTISATMVQYVHQHEVDPVDLFKNGIVSNSDGFSGRPFIPETRVVASDIQAFSDIYKLLKTIKRGQKTLVRTWGPLNSIVVRGKSVDISEDTINKMLHGPEYIAPSSVGFFEGKHHALTSEAEMEDPTSRERVMHWIAGLIASEGENSTWVAGTQLRPTSNDNTLSPSLTLLVACLMAGYPVNETVSLQANITPNKLVDKWTKAYKVTLTSKIKYVANHLFGTKVGPVRPLAFVPHIPVDMPQTDGSSKQGATLQPDADQVCGQPDKLRLPQVVECDVFTLEKRVKDEM